MSECLCAGAGAGASVGAGAGDSTVAGANINIGGSCSAGANVVGGGGSCGCLWKFINDHFVQVEWVLMRAMSLGLIRGVMDQVDGSVEVSWVQPRVLDQTQIEMLSSQLSQWSDR